MKTDTCKFDSNCKFHHPMQGSGSLRPALFNYNGYPIRPGEKECDYYMKTGNCKFSSTCKYHHPQPGGLSVHATAPTFSSMVQHQSNPSSHQYPHSASWQVSRPSMMPVSYAPGSYAPMVMSNGVVPFQGWSQYPVMSPVVTPGSQQTVQARAIYGIPNQASLWMPDYARHFASVSTSAMPSGTNQKEHIFPERPGQPECQFFMRNGARKFGATCKYHHPRDRSMSETTCIPNSLGFPLRPGAQSCAYYIQHGACKFGATCKFDHPVGSLSYSPSASSLYDMSVAPYPIGASAATMAPLSSSSELRPDFSFSRGSFSSILPFVNAASGFVGSVFSSKNFLPHLLIQPQTTMPSNSSR